MATLNTLWSANFPLFGATKIDFADSYLMQKEAPNLIAYALPAVIILTLIEFLVAHFGSHKTYEKQETLGSVLVGLGNLCLNLLMKVVLIYGAIWIYNQLPWRMELNWWTLIPCFMLYDCCSYWSHRISHINRFFWASHVVHHSAEHYNLTVAFRQSWVQHLKTVFFIPVALMGFHPVIFLVASQLSTLYQFWVHTEAIGKLSPFFEKYFGSPSNHRVHHGSQEKYLDKNFGATFMIWDHWFGTFQYEEEKPVYGLTTPLENKTNPLVLNFHEYRDMLKDVKGSDGIKECLFFIFASPGKIYRHKLDRNQQVPLPKEPHTKTTAIVLIMMLLLSQMVDAQPLKSESPLSIPAEKNLLFFLQRTPDVNIVLYELNYKPDGQLDPRRPVKGSWIRYEEQGRLKPLTSIEQQFTYGVKSKALGNEEYEIRLAAYQKMPMYLLKSTEDQKYHIYIRDEGQHHLLKRVFVKVKGGSFWFPKVAYIDLITTNSESGIEMLKRIDF
ncbi:DUF4833 domain-containing protein [Pedobacter gandavensis]|uniref:DUF4833 domain-containing protein n=1 Tax=Pedobacter gandavensis TaxID=2679963 RepID=UPI00292DDBFA|nr:DUF4833 domain-containing protein [Pedobacter gandavensis]